MKSFLSPVLCILLIACNEAPSPPANVVKGKTPAHHTSDSAPPKKDSSIVQRATPATAPVSPAEISTEKINALPVPRDTVFQKTILHQQYTFRVFSDGARHLAITHPPDSISLVDAWLELDGGDCNGHVRIVANYEVRSDSLFIYTYTDDTETWDVFHPINHTYVRKESYVFRRNGTVIKTGFLESWEEDATWNEVMAKVENQR